MNAADKPRNLTILGISWAAILTGNALVATLTYDRLARRIIKAVTNCGDWDRTYHDYYAPRPIRQAQG